MTGTITTVEDYVRSALQNGVVENAEDEGYQAYSRDVFGVFGFGDSREQAWAQLWNKLVEWVLISAENGNPIPIVNGIDLNTPEARAVIRRHERPPAMPNGTEFFPDTTTFDAAMRAQRT